MNPDSQPWEPLSDERLAAIIADTAKDDPVGDYCPDDVYRLACEVKRWRDMPKPPAEPPQISPKRAAKIALYLEYIAWRMRCG